MNTNQGYVAASGYPNYHLLNQPVISSMLTAQWYCETIVSLVTTTQYFGEIRNCGDTITFYREPRPQVFDYEEDMTLDSDGIDTCPRTLKVGRAKYYNLKLDRVTLDRVCRLPAMRDAYLRNVSKEMAQEIEQEFMCRWHTDVDPCNKGQTAGARTGLYNLGTEDEPITVQPKEQGADLVTVFALHQWLANINTTLNEVCAPRGGMEKFIVLPHEAYHVLLASDVTDANRVGNCISCPHPLISGVPPMQIMGFNIMFSHNVPRLANGAYHIVAGYKDATGFAQFVSRSEVVPMSSRSFSAYWRGYQIYGYDTLYPEFLTDSVAIFKATTS